jgi:O-antigen ligase
MIALVLLSGLIWLLILFHQIAHRGFLVLIIWLLIAPVMSNFVNKPGGNPLFNLEKAQKTGDVQAAHAAFLRRENNPIRLDQLLEPNRSLLGGFLIIFILGALLKKKHLGPFDSTEVWMGVFSLILLINVLLQSSRLHYSMRVASDAFIVPFFAYYITRRLVTNEERFHQFSRVMGYTGFYLIIIGLVEQLAHQSLLHGLKGPFRSTVPLFTITMVAFFAVLLNTICYHGFSSRQQSLPHGIRWSVLFLTPIIIFFTFSRGNWLGFLMGIWVFLFMARPKIDFLQKLGILGLAFITIPVIIIGLITLIPTKTFETQISNTHTIYGRIATWLIAIEKGAEHPIFGVGLNNLRNVLYETRTLFNLVGNFASVHNSFLAIFAEQGAIGLLAYLALVASIIRKGLNLYRAGMYFQDQWRGITVVTVIAAYLTPALFASTLHDYNPLTHIYVYAFIGAIAGLYGQNQLLPNTFTPLKYSQWTSKTTQAHV